jgi:hypothetical protein
LSCHDGAWLIDGLSSNWIHRQRDNDGNSQIANEALHRKILPCSVIGSARHGPQFLGAVVLLNPQPNIPSSTARSTRFGS